MDLEEDIREYVLHNLPHDPSLAAELRAKTAGALLIIYGNWQARLVPIGPRRVHRSKSLAANPLSISYKAGLDAVVSKLATGQDLKPHLSRGVVHGYKPPTRGRNRQDLDLLLNDWSVHHFHLSTILQADGFVERTGPLLFAVIRPEDAYLIDIIDHGGWTRDHVIETMVREWPDANLAWEIKGIASSPPPLTEAERKNLRNNHVNASFEIDGKTYMPAGGLTTAGTSTMNTMAVARLLRTLDWFKHQLKENPDFLKVAAAAAGLSLPTHPDLHFAFFPEGGFGVTERETGLRFLLGK